LKNISIQATIKNVASFHFLYGESCTSSKMIFTNFNFNIASTYQVKLIIIKNFRLNFILLLKWRKVFN